MFVQITEDLWSLHTPHCQGLGQTTTICQSSGMALIHIFVFKCEEMILSFFGVSGVKMIICQMEKNKPNKQHAMITWRMKCLNQTSCHGDVSQCTMKSLFDLSQHKSCLKTDLPEQCHQKIHFKIHNIYPGHTQCNHSSHCWLFIWTLHLFACLCHC